MPANKNQHFVPKAHLKPFTDEQAGHSISLYNDSARKVVHGAPVRNQCSRDYFYGKDLTLEHSFSEIEQLYASEVRRIHQAAERWPSVSADRMRLFWCFQWARTEGAALTAKSMSDGAAENFGVPLVKDSAKHNWVLTTLSCLKKAVEITSDLSMVMVRNGSELPFITSDDPAVLTNRYHLIDRKLDGAPFGLHSAGALLLLPLTPQLLALFFDPDVYSVTSTSGWSELRSDSDALSLNQLQIINCKRNVYFSRHLAHDWIADAFTSLTNQRRLPLWKYKYGILDAKLPGRDRYRLVSKRPEQMQTEAMILTFSVPRRPISWPSILRWRTRGSVYDSRSGAGLVRVSQVKANVHRKFERIRIDK